MTLRSAGPRTFKIASRIVELSPGACLLMGLRVFTVRCVLGSGSDLQLERWLGGVGVGLCVSVRQGDK